MENIGNLAEESAKRKERLKALKSKLTSGEKNGENYSANKSVTLPKPKFRSYNPSDENLKELKIDNAQPANIETEIKEQMEAATHKEVMDVLDISNLAPRKPDWDLKRDAAKKLEKLERRTQRAIAELIRERLAMEGTGDLAASVAIGADLNAAPDEE